MKKKYLKKFSTKFLQNFFPENLNPISKCTKKQKNIVKRLFPYFSRKIKKLETIILFENLKSLVTNQYHKNNKKFLITAPIFLASLPHNYKKTFNFFYNYNFYLRQYPEKYTVNILLLKALLQLFNNIFIKKKTFYPLSSLSSVSRYFSSQKDHNDHTEAIFCKSDEELQVFSKGIKNMKEKVPEKTSKKLDLYHFLTILQQRTKIVSILYTIDQIKNEYIKKQITFKRSSDFKNQIKEKKKLSLFYGYLPKKQLKKIYSKILKYQGRVNQNILLLLENRLDIILHRICFFKNIRSARHSINHKFVKVNNKITNIPSYKLQIGDIISIDNKKYIQIQKNILYFLENFLQLRKSHYIISNNVLNNIEKTLKLYHTMHVTSTTTKVAQSMKGKGKNDKIFIYRSFFSSKGDNENPNFVTKTYKNPALAKQGLQSNLGITDFLDYKKFLKQQKLTKRLIEKNKQDSVAQSMQGKELFKNFTTIKDILNNLFNKNYYRKNISKTLHTSSKGYNEENFKDLKVEGQTNKLKEKIYYNDLTNTIKGQLKKLHIIRSLYLLELLQKKTDNRFSSLEFKKTLYRKRSRQQILSAFRFSIMKPLNVEISYNFLSAIYMYAPQKVAYPILIDFDLLVKSLQ